MVEGYGYTYKPDLDREEYEYQQRMEERKKEEEENKIRVFTYRGEELKGEDKKITIDNFMSDRLNRMEEKSNKRILLGKQQIDRLKLSRRKDTKVQVRNTYEGNIIKKYAISEGLEAQYLTGDQQENIIKTMEIVLPSYDYDHTPGECSCARHHVRVENESRPVLYVYILNKK